jgi:signal transduction histidine kinase
VRLGDRLTRLAARPDLPRRTIRLRLTLLYGGLFLLSGAALLAITYVLMVHATKGFVFKGENGSVGSVQGSPKPGSKTGELELQTSGRPDGRRLTPQQQLAQARQLEAQAKRQHDSELHQLLTQSGIALAAMAVVSIGLGWLVAGRVLRPLRTITTSARDISAANLHERLALAGPDDELKELGDTFDALLERLEASFQAQRRFVANASHELRTPLARQRALVQVALGDPDATIQSLRRAHERVLVSELELERLIDALLTLSRGQAGLNRREGLDLADVTDQVLVHRRSEAARRGLELHAALSPAPATGDARLVERLVANLVDNALRHNVPDGRVEVATNTDAGHAVLSVTNTGPTVPVAAVDQLIQPFQRLVPERTHREGVGLGLSIVQAIATTHDATLRLRPQPEGGLHVDVSFPPPSRRPDSQIKSSISRSSTPDRRARGKPPATEASTTPS